MRHRATSRTARMARFGRHGYRHLDPVTIAAVATAVPKVVGIVTELFGPPGGGEDAPLSADPTDDLTPEVRAWWNSGMGGQWFTDWLLANEPRAFRWNLEQLLPLYYAALWATGKTPFWSTGDAYDGRLYRQGLTEDAFASFGVDYPATWDRYRSLPSDQRTPSNVYVMLPSAGPVTDPLNPRSRTKEGTTDRPGGAKAMTASIGTGEILIIAALAYFIFKG